MSGYVTIVNRDTQERMEVPGEEILDFVAHYVRLRRISKIEQMTLEQLLEG
jgi:hypothetical protein